MDFSRSSTWARNLWGITEQIEEEGIDEGLTGIMKTTKPNWIFVLAGIIGIIFLAPSIFYFSIFSSGLSSNQETWGQFGDFIGGILNPFLSFVSMIILAYLTHLVSQNDQKTSEKALKVQRKLVISQLRQQAFSEYISNVDAVIQNGANHKSINASIVGVTNRIKSFNENNQHLFPFLGKQIFTSLLETMNEVSSIVQKISENEVAGISSNANYSLLSSKIESIANMKLAIVKMFQTLIIDDLA